MKQTVFIDETASFVITKVRGHKGFVCINLVKNQITIFSLRDFVANKS